MSHCRTVLLPMILLLAAPGAFAQDRTGFSVHAGVGASQLEDDDASGSFDGNAFGYALGVEYRFTRHFSLGVDVFDLGTADDTVNGVETEIDAEGIDVFAHLFVPINDTVELYVHGGATLYNTSVRPDIALTIIGDDAVSLGGGVDIGRGNITLRLDGRYFNGSNDESGTLLTAGINYRF